ncbi:MAG: rhodanese-like domain-containing protein [Gemmataceae bacterium]|nr:rhodanese-like domain-containing protein [Gemmata sp.]MDW8197971.1 rhodanese-like domain-containing protein [Gemmataceae bacterium]
MSVRTITPAELYARHQRGEPVEVIDVRTPVEFREVHCPLARNIPLTELDPSAVIASRSGSADQPLYIICKSGSRGRQACEKFLAAGFANVINVEGGTSAWEAAGLPVNRGKKAISLERQVRIAAGSLVLLGVALGWWVHPGFLVIAAFVGAGLVFAGITDTCGMGLLLARMPWNQVGATCAVAGSGAKSPAGAVSPPVATTATVCTVQPQAGGN